MRITFFTPFYTGHADSTGREIFQIAAYLGGSGHQVKVICTDFDLRTNPDVPNVEVIKEPSIALVEALPKNNSQGKAAIASLTAMVNRLAVPDVVVAVEPDSYAGTVAAQYAQSKGVPLVIWAHGTAPNERGFFAKRNQKKLRSTFAKAKQLIAAGNPVRDLIQSWFVQPLPAVVVHPWTDGDDVLPLPGTDSFRAVWDLDGKFVLMAIGLNPNSDAFRTTLSALQMMESSNRIWFVYLADSKWVEQAQQEVDAKGLSNVICRRQVPESDLNRALASAHMHLIESDGNRKTSVMMPFILASGKGTIGVMSSGTNEAHWIHEGQFGTQVGPNDPAGLAKILDELCADPEVAARYGNRARQFFESNMQLRECVPSIAEHILSAV